MLLELHKGTLYLKDIFVDNPQTIPEIPPIDLNHPPQYVRSINFPLSSEAEFTMEAEIDIPTLNKFICGFDTSPMADATAVMLIYSKPYQEQVRRHKKKRINKKWAKRYGYVTKFKQYCIEDVHYQWETENELDVLGRLSTIAIPSHR